jgi:hypothetical protein
MHRSSTLCARRFGTVALMCVLLIPLVARVSAQQKNPPLAEVARKEAERRKGIKDTQKVITNKDLPESARKERPAPGDAAAAAGGAETGDAKPAEQKESKASGGDNSQKDEAYWHNRITQAQDNLRRSEAFLSALQSQVNGLTTDFVNRDDPYQRAKIGEERQRAVAEMERVKADIELAKKQIADTEEDARKAGVPPGWLR